MLLDATDAVFTPAAAVVDDDDDLYQDSTVLSKLFTIICEGDNDLLWAVGDIETMSGTVLSTVEKSPRSLTSAPPVN